MIWRLGVLLVYVAYTSVTSALPPCVCTREMQPVCGTDGQTYNNMCLLRCQQGSHPSLQLANYGRCRGVRETGNEESCICTLEYDPVCGSDGRTYPNRCAMDCDAENRGNVQVLYEGECREKQAVQERSCLCPYNYLPVCGTDGKTYSNECSLKCQDNVQVAHQGPCRAKRDACICPMIYAPVCGTNGKTYGNKCALDCDGGVEVAYHGRCRAKRQVAAERVCLCHYNLALVCGTDGETYPNECVLKCKDNVGVAYNGACKEKREVEYEPPACFCTFENDPVCGSNGRTYDNMCNLECEGDQVQLAYKGECKVKRETIQIADLPPPCICTREDKPVCGTDGKTYSNPCLLNCLREQREDLHILHPGPCGNEAKVREVILNLMRQPGCTCPRNMAPVCASNGQTYSNECMMICADSDLTVESYEPCNN